ncbi:general odorant-binding protein 99a isoform X1 [Zeugodacus cucurbitae]|uniref:general odorant-binding protein 99a isoform X1 n=1 Tax=Zeugodacus cucurbitae TaxID=28588 RepID=UPI0023D8E3D8|nr:general odorant-binding protein 99a isoform X1 [Zeugodacus cucurbitae]
MKTQLILLLACVALVAGKFQIRTAQDALAAHEACHDEFRIPEDIYEKYLNYEFPPHKRTNCYVKCFVERMGLFTEEKGFDEKAIIAQFTAKSSKNLAKVSHGLEKCIDHNEHDSDTCTWANRVFSCWISVNRPIVRRTYIEN